MIMTHKEWMKLTDGGLLSVRSGKLKAVDAALEQYHQAPGEPKLEALRKALMGWIQEKGPAWKTSERNKHHAVETLHAQVLGGGGGAGAIDAKALAAVKAETRQLVIILFRGAKVTWKNEFRVKLNTDLINPLKSNFALKLPVKQAVTSGANNKFGIAGNTAGLALGAKTLASSGGSGAVTQAIEKLMAEVVPKVAQSEVLSALQVLVPTFQKEFAAAVMPVAGLLISAGATLWNTGKAIHKEYGVIQARIHRERSMSEKDADEAIRALIRILERERNADIFGATASLLEFGGKIAGLAIDGGTASNTAIGVASNIAKLLNIIRVVYRDVQEKNAANRLMLKGTVDHTIFETCPLLGCYLICAVPTSALMSLIFNRIGDKGWMDVGERVAKRHVNPLREKAREVIAAHRFEIVSLARFPGMLKVNEDNLKAMMERKGKSGMEGFGSDSLPANLRVP